jgi:hypothetical protein
MRWIGLAALLMTSVALAPPARADFYAGDTIRKLCTDDSPLLLGYLAGWIDKWGRDTDLLARGYENETSPQAKRTLLTYLQKTTEGICVPEDANLGQMQIIVCNYVDQHPSKRTLGSAELISASLAQAWRCKR